MQASIDDVGYNGDELEVSGQVPFDTAKEFQVELKSMTGGMGIFEMEFWSIEGADRKEWLKPFPEAVLLDFRLAQNLTPAYRDATIYVKVRHMRKNNNADHLPDENRKR